MKLQSTHSIKAILEMSKEIKILQQARKLPGIHEIFLFYFEMLLGNRVGNEHTSKEVILCQSSGKSLNMLN
jgi:hypothetical protein